MTIGTRYRCFLKLFVTWSPRERVLRLGRLVWCRGVPGLPGGGYSAKFSWALTPRLLSWRRGWHEWHLVFAGLRLHYRRSYGGYIA